jgi:hypothetical protein
MLGFNDSCFIFLSSSNNEASSRKVLLKSDYFLILGKFYFPKEPESFILGYCCAIHPNFDLVAFLTGANFNAKLFYLSNFLIPY